MLFKCFCFSSMKVYESLMNNNKKTPSAAGRLAQLPVVRSACAKLSVLYGFTKLSHPNLKSVCDVLENSVTALGTAACYRVSPVIVKLEPQISFANDMACKSLDWLEASFPVILSPTEQIVTTAKNKMYEIQAAMSIVANGTMDCVQNTVTRVKSGLHDGANKSLVDRVIGVAIVGLDTVLILSEALTDRVLPPTEEEAAHLIEGFEAVTHGGRYPERLLSLTSKVCRRIYHVAGSRIQTVQVMESLSRSSGLVQNMQTTWQILLWRVQRLPQYLQNQALFVLFFITQMYNVRSKPTRKKQSNQIRSCLKAVEASTPQKGIVQVHLQSTPPSRMRKATKISDFDNGCNFKERVHR